MANCVLCSEEHTFMNASVGNLSDGGSVCRNCFKKIVKLKSNISIKKYSFDDINNILLGKELQKPNKELQKPNTDQIEKPKMDSKLIVGLIKIISSLILLYLSVKYLFFN